MDKQAYPLMFQVEQKLVSRPVADIPARVRAEMARWDGWGSLKPGARIAVTAGSRGINNIPLILRAVCDELKNRGYEPFIVPAMGSHGGARVDEQRALLESLGVSEQAVAAPIKGSLEIDEVARFKTGQPVVMDRLARRADGLIIVGRVKKHTDFRGAIESGLMKMTVIGLGKHYQAAYVHSFGSNGLRDLIPQFGQIALMNSPALFGLAVIEDGYDATSDIVMIPREHVLTEEPKLLRRSISQMAKLPVHNIDVLIVERIGKEISGAGMDTNVIGRYMIPGVAEPRTPRCRFIIALDVTDASHGNAVGIGLADLTTERLVKKMDHVSFYMNSATSGFLERTKIPLTCANDQTAIDLALRLLAPLPAHEARIVRIQDTLHLTRFWASEPVAKELDGDGRCRLVSDGQRLSFAGDGALV